MAGKFLIEGARLTLETGNPKLGTNPNVPNSKIFFLVCF
jgi:hypothetical protein